VQLRRALGPAALALLVAGPAYGDGEVTVRKVYYKESATRVIQPMLDARFELGGGLESSGGGELAVHSLVDVITSASVASGAAGEPFTENRYELGARYLHSFGDVRVGGWFRYSHEPDYLSLFAGVRAELDLAQRNTLLGAAVSAGHDTLDNSGAQGGLSELVEGELRTALGSLSLTQLLSPLVLAGVTYDVIHLRGFQENPYRTVVAGGVVEPERVPSTRLRHALFATTRGHVPRLSATIVAGYRFYIDDWGITAHTPELRWIQDLSPRLALHLRYRYYRQGAADFYKDIYDSNDPAIEPWITDDTKLSAFSTQTFGVKADAALALFGVGGAAGRWRVDAVLEYITQDNRYGDAVVGQVAFTIPFEY
jgi:hypothetical protein